MVSHWSLSDTKSPQVSRTLLSILADINNAVVRIVSTRPLISKPSSPVTVLFMFHVYHHFHVLEFFQLSIKVKVFISLFALFQFYLLVSRNGEVHNSASSLYNDNRNNNNYFFYSYEFFTAAEADGLSLEFE